MQTKKLFFPEDKTVDGVLTFKAGETYDIPVETGSYARWIKRGALPVEECQEPEVLIEANAEEVTPEASEVDSEEALASLGGEEEVVNEAPKKENKKANKPKK